MFFKTFYAANVILFLTAVVTNMPTTENMDAHTYSSSDTSTAHPIGGLPGGIFCVMGLGGLFCAFIVICCVAIHTCVRCRECAAWLGLRSVCHVIFPCCVPRESEGRPI